MFIVLIVLAYFFFVIVGMVFGALIGVIVLIAKLATFLLRRPQKKRLLRARTQQFIFQMPETHQQKLDNHPDSVYAQSFLPPVERSYNIKFAETQKKYAAIQARYPNTSTESPTETL